MSELSANSIDLPLMRLLLEGSLSDAAVLRATANPVDYRILPWANMVKIGGQSLPAGVYGVGFIGDNKFVVTDIGAHDVFTVSSSTDDEMKRPMPMQVTIDPNGGFRLYAGRRYVTFTK